MSAALLVAGCMTSPPVPSQVPGHPTATTEAEAWRSLRQRPLHLPALAPGTPCPTTHGHQAIPGFSDFVLGDGPVYADFVGGSDNMHGVLHYGDAQSFGDGRSDWGGQKVLWVIKPPYRGPVLIRGGRLGGSSPMRFNGGLDQQGPWDYSNQALLLQLRLTGAIDYDSPWPSWGTYTRLQAPGCYAYQVDGLTFSYPIIFKAIAEHSPPPKP